MKQMQTTLKGLIIFLSLLPSIAFSGGSDGSGGKGVVCRGSDGSIESVELLDLWEERIIRRNKIVPSARSIEERVDDAIKAFKGAIETYPGATYRIVNEGPKDGVVTAADYSNAYIKAFAGYFLKDSKLVIRMRDVKLTPTDDSFEAAQPAGRCAIEQIVNFIDSDTSPEILVNQDLLDKMDETNKAALYVHEALYLFMRGAGSEGLLGAYKESNSIRIRRAVGHIFSGHSFESIDQLAGKEFIACSSGQASKGSPSSIFIFQDEKGKARLANAVLFGRPIIGFFPRLAKELMPWDDLLKRLDRPSCAPRKVIDPTTGKSAKEVAKVFRNPGVGPVDFQTMSWISLGCRRNKTVMILNDETYIFDGETNGRRAPQELKCQLVKPTSKP